ncbi:MAG: PorV/PorQ family protein [Elusimicrobia bacterium]|nr:PorV/PorQ family protein [Elusimicrobiota bacterium]
MVKKGFVVLAVLSMLGSGSVYAGREGSTIAQFLKIGSGARLAALGESFVGIADDADSLYWNPAGLANISSLEATASGAMLYEGIFYGFIGAAGKAEKLGGAVGLSVTHLGMSEMTGFDASGNPAPDYGAHDLAVAISYGRKVKPGVLVGGNIKSIRQKIENESAAGFGADIGGLYVLDKTSVGIAIRNMGTSMGFHEKSALPLLITLGASHRLRPDLLLCSDLNLPFDYHASLHLGGEYLYREAVTFRAGLRTTNISALGLVSALSVGVGLKIKSVNFDYALLPYGNLGTAHRISISNKFGQIHSGSADARGSARASGGSEPMESKPKAQFPQQPAAARPAAPAQPVEPKTSDQPAAAAAETAKPEEQKSAEQITLSTPTVSETEITKPAPAIPQVTLPAEPEKPPKPVEIPAAPAEASPSPAPSQAPTTPGQ